MTIVEKEDTKDLMKSFENLPKESKRYIQGFLAGLETAERNREDAKCENFKAKDTDRE